jgi:hypothetical protein
MINIGADDHTMALPVDKKKLGEFISGLLGQPQSITKDFEDSFDVDHQWFLHFFSLILQRLQQQNSPEPLSFEARIYYKNKVQRKITSWQAFQHFSETQNIISVGVKFNLAFLIQFPSKEIPERQEITIDFDAGKNQQSRGIFELLVGPSVPQGKIQIDVRHTERTWADDMLRLMETEISSIQVQEAKFRTFLRKIFGALTLFAFPITMLGAMGYTQLSEKDNHINENVQRLLKLKDMGLSALNEKVNILLVEAQKSSSGRSDGPKIFFYAIMVAAVMYILGLFLAQPNPSFVVLSKAAERNKHETNTRLKRKGLILILSTIASIALGVFGNFIYDSIK